MISSVNLMNEPMTTNKATPLTHSKAKKKQKIHFGNDTISQAKDRAQMTSTTAMSVVHIALLKNVLDQGPKMNRYYPSLILLIISLTLQIAAGLMSMMISHMRIYYSKYKDDMWAECCSKYSCNTDKVREKCTYDEMLNSESAREMIREKIPDPKTPPLCGCCVTSPKLKNIMSEWERVALEVFEDWKAEHTISEVKAAEADIKIPILKKEINAIKEKLEELTSSQQQLSKEKFDEQYKKLSDELENVKERKEFYSKIKYELEISEAQGKILTEEAEAIMEEKVLKMVSFWQNVMNIMLYCVFVLNAFITGIGLGATSVKPVA